MLSNIKSKYDETRQYVRTHKTHIACAATAGVTFLTARRYYSDSIEILTHVYDAEIDVLTLQRDVLLDFVNEHDMKDDVLNHIKLIGERVNAQA